MSRLRAAITWVVWTVGFPIAWPVLVARTALHRRRHEARRARCVAEGALVAEIARGAVRSAVRSTVSWSTFASGHDEETLVELDLGGSRAVVAWSSALDDALRAAGIPTREEHSHAFGCFGAFAWGLWLVSILVIGAVSQGSWPLAALAGLVLVGLVLVLFS